MAGGGVGGTLPTGPRGSSMPFHVGPTDQRRDQADSICELPSRSRARWPSTERLVVRHVKDQSSPAMTVSIERFSRTSSRILPRLGRRRCWHAFDPPLSQLPNCERKFRREFGRPDRPCHGK